MSLRADYWGDVEVTTISITLTKRFSATFGDKAGTKISILAVLERLCGYVSGGDAWCLLTPPGIPAPRRPRVVLSEPRMPRNSRIPTTNQPDLRPLCDSAIGSFELWKSDRGNGALLIPLQAFNQLNHELLAGGLPRVNKLQKALRGKRIAILKAAPVRLVQSLGRLNRSQLDAVISLFDLPQEDLPAASSPVAELAEAIVRLAEHRGEDEIQNIERIVQSTNRFERSLETLAMSKFFISYRRQDSRDIAGPSRFALAPHFGRDGVFIDIEAIPLGVEFPKHLSRRAEPMRCLLAVIGDRWLDAAFGEDVARQRPAAPRRSARFRSNRDRDRTGSWHSRRPTPGRPAARDAR